MNNWLETLNEILKKEDKSGYQVTIDKLQPGTYLFFTDDDGCETNCINVKDIINIEWDEEGDTHNGLIVFSLRNENEEYQLALCGGIWAIEIT